MTLFEIFKKHVLSPEDVLNKGIDSVLPPSTNPIIIKKKFLGKEIMPQGAFYFLSNAPLAILKLSVKSVKFMWILIDTKRPLMV